MVADPMLKSRRAPLAALWRGEFPILAEKTYLANHSMGAVPRRTAQALLVYHETWARLGIQAWEGPWWEALLEFCRSIEELLGATGGTVVPMANTTAGLATVGSCFDWSGRRNGIVLTDLEFTTSFPVWRALEDLGARVRIVPSPDGRSVPAERIAEAIDDRTLLVQTCHAYFRSGALQELNPIVEAAHRQGAFVVVDGYQVVGSVPVDVTDLEVDFYVGGCHKWLCGGPGAGFLYVRPDLVPTLRPRDSGWFGLAEPFSYEPGTGRGTPADGVFRFLGGTPNMAGLFAAREGIRIVREIGVEAIRESNAPVSDLVVERALERGYDVRSPLEARDRSGMVCFDFEGARSAVDDLVRRGIVVDWRPDCGIRVSPHFYNGAQDVDRVFEALDGGSRAQARA